MEAVTDSMEVAASTADLSTARRGLLHSMSRLVKSLVAPAPADGCTESGETEHLNIKFHGQSRDRQTTAHIMIVEMRKSSCFLLSCYF